MQGSLLCSFVALLFLVALPETRAHGGAIENGYSADGFEAWWEILDDHDGTNSGTFFMKAPINESNAWIAIGFKNIGVQEFDVIVAYNGTATDRWVQSNIFKLDTTIGGKNDVSDTSSAFKDGFIEAEFTRKLNTGDKYDYDLDGEIPILFWAFGTFSGDNLTTINSGEEKYNIWPDGMENEPQQFKNHGILMVFVVMICMTSGMVLSRYLKTVFYWWFYVHAAVFVFALVFITISCVIIFQAHHNEFKASTHSVFGLLFIIAMGVQSFIGLISHLQFDKKRLAPPNFPDKTHWWLGRACFFIGIIAVILGFDILPARRLARNSFWLFLILIFFLVLTLEKYVGQTHETVSKGIAEDDEAFDTRDDDDLMYVPKKGNSLSIGRPAKQLSIRVLLKILVPAGLGIGVLFICVAVGINTTIL